jgi:hypothetical protein
MGSVDLVEAQRKIAIDWRAAYREWIGPQTCGELGPSHSHAYATPAVLAPSRLSTACGEIRTERIGASNDGDAGKYGFGGDLRRKDFSAGLGGWAYLRGASEDVEGNCGCLAVHDPRGHPCRQQCRLLPQLSYALIQWVKDWGTALRARA